MMRRARFLVALIVLTADTATSTQAAEVWIQAKAVTESGSALANGTYSVVLNAEPKGTPVPSTQGNSMEPVAMYMLLSYVASPTPFLLNTPLAQGDRIVGKTTDQLVEEIGDWGGASPHDAGDSYRQRAGLAPAGAGLPPSCGVLASLHPFPG